ncbi:Bifunctional (p)ppGpp synthase/hydrolase relA [Brevibacterium casei]|uniref:Bifunctional (P)ppGpp synthase/hydrolase relA n=1 Tax=Brevibacterium casei TaxID=33889 RepID=A0A449D1F6_9MICO|nr:Bifunctional (p)ppGpp synthase/hydrolase relA [Brevibacterium casei]
MSQEALQVVSTELRLPDVTALYAAIGNGVTSAAHVVDLLAKEVGDDEEAAVLPPAPRNRTGQSSGHHSSSGGVVVKGVDDVLVKLARCCPRCPGMRSSASSPGSGSPSTG